MRRWAVCIGFLALPLTASVVAVADDCADRTSLAALTPLVAWASDVGRAWVDAPIAGLLGGFAAAALLLVTVAFAAWLTRRPGAAVLALFSSAMLAGLGGQLALLIHHFWFGLALFLGSFTLAGFVPTRDFTRSEPFLAGEVVALFALTLVATFFRFYALNRVLGSFDGELSPYMVGATSPEGMWLANVGHQGPWAPLGILYYIPIWLTTELAGPTPLAVRLSSALISIGTAWLAWFVVREMAGRSAALLTFAFLALDPLQIGWGRSDVHPHGATTWPTLWIVWLTWRAIVHGRTSTWLWIPVAMAVSWHQYPSGQFAVVIPLVALATASFLRPGFFRESRWKLTLLAPGLAAWILGYPLVHWVATGEWTDLGEYLRRLGPRVLVTEDSPPGMVGSLAVRVVEHLEALVTGIFVRAPYIFHQTWIPEVPPLPIRAVPWFVAGLLPVSWAVLARSARSPVALVLFGWLIAALAPAIFAEKPYLKRGATLYPLLSVQAGIVVGFWLEEVRRVLGRIPRLGVDLFLGALFVVGSAVPTFLWFSGERYRYGVPEELLIADRVQELAQPETLFFFDAEHHYMKGKMTFLLLDVLRDESRQPLAWVAIRDDRPGSLGKTAEDPVSALRGVPADEWTHAWSGRRDQLQKAKKHADWQRVVFVLQEAASLPQKVEHIREACTQSAIETFRYPSSYKPEDSMTFVICERNR